MRKFSITAAAALLVSPVSATAQNAQPAAQPASAAKPAEDPNQMVCEKQEVPGSRIATQRICHTRAQWADLRAQDRQEIEKVQTQRGCSGKGC